MITITCDKYSEYVWIRYCVDTGVLNAPNEFRNYFEQNGWNSSQYVTYEKSDIYYDDTPIDKKGFHIIKNTEDK